MPDSKFDLGDYVQVKDRIAKFYELFGQGRLVTQEVTLTTEPDGKPRVMVKALAYRTPDDPLPGVGCSWLELPGATPYTRGSELENAETSAWGRAIGALGILIDGSIATGNEIQNKAEGETPAPAVKGETETLLGELGRSRVGTIAKTKSRGSDLQVRETPSGPHLGFKFETPKGAIEEVWAEGPVAEFLFAAASMDPSKLEGEKAVVNGLLYRVTEANRKTKHRLRLSAIEVLDVHYPPTVPIAFPEAAEPTESDALPPEAQTDVDAATDALWPAGVEAPA